MSYLGVDNRSSRARSKSGTRDRSRSRTAARVESPPKSSGYGYAPPTTSASQMPGSFDTATAPTYEVRSPPGAADRSNYFPPTTSGAQQYGASPAHAPYPADNGFTMGDYTDFPPHERPGYVQRAAQFPAPPRHEDDDLAYGANSPMATRHASYSNPGPQNPTNSRHASYGDPAPPQSQYPGQRNDAPADSGYRYTPQAGSGPQTKGSTGSYQYAQPPDQITYTARPQTGQTRTASYTKSAEPPYRDVPRKYSHSQYSEDAQIVEITPGRDPRDRYDRDPRDQRDPRDYRDQGDLRSHDQRDRVPSMSGPHRPSISSQQPNLHTAADSTSNSRRLSVNTQQSAVLGAAADGLGAGMHRLSVSGHGPAHPGDMPPPSPLLEAYRGTYQSLSPMPLALRPADDDDDLSDLEPLTQSLSRSGKDKTRDKLDRERTHNRSGSFAASSEKKRVTLYNPEEDARKIDKALKHHKADPDPIIDILPGLTHDQTWLLRKEYKKQVKIQGKGISLPKHLKLKLTGNFGKAAYVTALGRFESEGYWANFWYQAHGNRRELLIESLMGRTNGEIRMIKDEFKDKRYSDSLEKCMEKELKMDKFRSAVLMVLEERRQEEQDVYPAEYVDRDVETLFRALSARQGGESAMLEVVVKRSDAHLRRVLEGYQRAHGENFARAALKKSNNLVGEVIAHILNGVINKPVRDALLLNHAIDDVAARNKDDELRYELLTSRLIRAHWDRLHLERVKRAYAQKFGKQLKDDIEGATKGDLRDFFLGLVETR
ncbi:hypothetical protein LTR35_014199 [Friedmanniomyces endolithicus]|uniref:Annexin n=1 Tax=Friedmanniomyces endolithicus TaxID=329885 RepID=A0AAN6FG94_9PEZI|nr:hypothetical protein LTR35_014199 [Friedmanniomyces endolithicus]KAK0278311.1 hypothetical protein LTS00_013923 [Friedmanniomyces endolithicus]KAK0316963.1 hypothetical protein LTR82_012105 [Friedmanniomyces endolithicus]KAK0982475.1 hypothetical protein LTR54_014705 [Friedmanniomyces endolithicus]